MTEIQRERNGHFKKGVSGNPHGRPKGRTLASLMKEIGEEKVYDIETESQSTRLQALVRRLFELAQRGNVAAASLIFNRVEGLPKRHQDDGASSNVVVLVDEVVPDGEPPDDESF